MRDLEALQAYCLAHELPLDARQLRTGTLRAFLAGSFDGRTASTMARKVSAVRAFYRFLEKRGKLRDNPAASLSRPKVPKPLPEFVTVEDAFRVVAAPNADAAEVTDRSSGISFPVASDATLLEALQGAGLKINFGCRAGVCGADPVAVCEGAEHLSPPGDEELAHRRQHAGRVI